ncbi:2OG-Fe(II) oxygenase [Sphingomonas sanguinis]|uniref:2OG-Fe(II) oxygenase n=1 Tax=Sphingomonas sanguinis TaxID=33051 RepID=UPI001C5685FD|nr:2OG-Fe(II) oxygenase [Sphingomonas sanguinis]QXT34375.1 2OG-Fe(II) oxygenase [Sphingomonas sanguinis]
MSAAFINDILDAKAFPTISVGELLRAARAGGVPAVGASAGLEEMRNNAPFLTYLKRDPDSTAANLVRIEEVRQKTVIIGHDRFGADTLTRENVEALWTGVVILVNIGNDKVSAFSEIDNYRQMISVESAFMSKEKCYEIIDYCESLAYRRSRISENRSGVNTDTISIKARSSSSVVLRDRSNPLVAEIYRRCADIERLPEQYIETIQSVRYKKGQRFRTHFDGGLGLPRLTTFLLYLNEEFSGGETYFPMLDMAVSPKTGSCLRFPSCMPDGRVIWQSEHGGLPVTDGTKYALNIWVRCPNVPVSV